MNTSGRKLCFDFSSTLIFVVQVIAQLVVTKAATAQVLIPVANRVAHVYDHIHNVLYIATPTDIQRRACRQPDTPYSIFRNRQQPQ